MKITSKSWLYRLSALLILALAALAAVLALLFVPQQNNGYLLNIQAGSNWKTVGQQLQQDNVVLSDKAVLLAAWMTGNANKLKAGRYRLPREVSAYHLVRYLMNAKPERVSVRIIEGTTFAAMRRTINQTLDLEHVTEHLSDAELIRAIDKNYQGPANLEGLFFPDSYEVDALSSDLEIYKAAYRKMHQVLDKTWKSRASSLPYRTKYELLIVASLIEKETGHADDRADIAAVFVSRLKKNMRLQTDPTVIYGLGEAYTGRLRKADLQRDTPYNTYTRNGLPPTPIALPSQAAIEAAAHPSNKAYLYFVSKMDDTGKSYFSHDLDEHNRAVHQYILRRGQP